MKTKIGNIIQLTKDINTTAGIMSAGECGVIRSIHRSEESGRSFYKVECHNTVFSVFPWNDEFIVLNIKPPIVEKFGDILPNL